MQHLSLAALLGIVITVTLGFGVIFSVTLRATGENRAAIAELRHQNVRQAELLNRSLGVVCDNSFSSAIILKAFRNIAAQAHLDVSGIPSRLPSEVVRACGNLP